MASIANAQNITHQESHGGCNFDFVDQMNIAWDGTHISLKLNGASSDFEARVLTLICNSFSNGRIQILPRGHYANGDGKVLDRDRYFYRIGVADQAWSADLDYGLKNGRIVAEFQNVSCANNSPSWEVVSQRTLSQSSGSLIDGTEYHIRCSNGQLGTVLFHLGQGQDSYQVGTRWFARLDEAARHSCM